MHAMGDVIDMRRFRGLRHRLPYTCATFAVGGLALSGVFPLSGFFSKDEILTRSSRRLGRRTSWGIGWHWVYFLVYLLAIVTAFMTAFYTGRAFFMTFWGPREAAEPGRSRGARSGVPASDAPGARSGTCRRSATRTAMRTVTVRADTSATNRRRS